MIGINQITLIQNSKFHIQNYNQSSPLKYATALAKIF